MNLSDLTPDLEIELKKRSRTFSAVAMFFLVMFGTISFLRGFHSHAMYLFIFAGITMISHLFISNGKYYRVHVYLIVFLMGALCLTMLYTGGIDGSGPLWYIVFPLLALFMLGIKGGIIAISVLFVASLLMVMMVDTSLESGIYSVAMIERFLAVIVTVIVLSLFYEYSRHSFTTRLQNMYNEMMKAARTDDLTGLPNRRYMKECLSYEAHRSHRNEKVFSVILGDIDYFKQVNDNYGHECGDYVLKTLAELIRDTLRNQDIVARWGGEEFLILLPDTDSEGAVKIAEKLRHIISSHRFDYLNKHFFVQLSLGVAQAEPPFSMQAYLRKADENLYLAKERGRNRVIAA